MLREAPFLENIKTNDRFMIRHGALNRRLPDVAGLGLC